MPRPSNSELIESYISDLKSDLEDLEPDSNLAVKYRKELSELEYAIENNITIGIDRYGIPSIEAGKKAEIEALKLISVLTNIKF